MPSSNEDSCTDDMSKDEGIRQLCVEIALLKHELKKKTELLEKKKVNSYLPTSLRDSHLLIKLQL